MGIYCGSSGNNCDSKQGRSGRHGPPKLPRNPKNKDKLANHRRDLIERNESEDGDWRSLKSSNVPKRKLGVPKYNSISERVRELYCMLPGKDASDELLSLAMRDFNLAKKPWRIPHRIRHQYFISDIVVKMLIHARHDNEKWQDAQKLLKSLGRVAAIHSFGAMFDIAEPGHSNIMGLAREMNGLMAPWLVAVLRCEQGYPSKALPSGMSKGQVVRRVRREIVEMLAEPPDRAAGELIAKKLGRGGKPTKEEIEVLIRIGYSSAISYWLLESMEKSHCYAAIEVLRTYPLNEELAEAVFKKAFSRKCQERAFELLAHYASRSASDAKKVGACIRIYRPLFRHNAVGIDELSRIAMRSIISAHAAKQNGSSALPGKQPMPGGCA